MNNNMNSLIGQIMEWKEKGLSPQQVAQMLFQQNPQLQTLQTQFSNMAKGKNPKEFVMQLAKQNNVDQATFNMINKILGN